MQGGAQEGHCIPPVVFRSEYEYCTTTVQSTPEHMSPPEVNIGNMNQSMQDSSEKQASRVGLQWTCRTGSPVIHTILHQRAVSLQQ